MVMDASGNIGETIHSTNATHKGKKGGRKIPLNKEVRKALLQLKDSNGINIDDAKKFVIQTQTQEITSAEAIENKFREWFKKLGFVGASTHSGRRTFPTKAARKVS